MDWTRRWGYDVRPTKAQGIHELRGGGFLVHAKISARGKKRTVSKVVRSGTLRDAQRERVLLIEEAKGLTARPSSRFSEYAPSLYERKVALHELKSAKSRERWDTTLRIHLLPAFGSSEVGAITKLDIEAWKLGIAEKIDRGIYAPSTANGWLSILRIVIRAAVDDLRLERDPTLNVRDFPTAEHPTYTDEEPNALSPAQAAKFLALFGKKFPMLFAFVLLGFVTGLRPSTMRPLRRRGPLVDIDWKKSILLVRRSHSLGKEVMETTKTDVRYRIGLPSDVMAVLRAHAAALRGVRAESDLLFPGKVGGFLARSSLDRPFAEISHAMKLPFRFTPRGMRRTYQDLARAEGLEKQITKAVCGHDTDEMREHYSTIRPEETRAAVAKLSKALLRRKVA